MPPLKGCVQDAEEMGKMLNHNEGGGLNYDIRILPNEKVDKVTRRILRTEWLKLFDSYRGNILFYFSGHGVFTKFGGHLVTQERTPMDPGLAMNELLQLANESVAEEVFLILDCCNSGALGDESKGRFAIFDQAQLREGVTILAVSRDTESAVIQEGRSVFTNLLLGALSGGAADVRGHVSAASIYAYSEASLGAFDQRPLYKSYATKLTPLRYGKPAVEDSLLRELPKFFLEADSEYKLDPSYEFTESSADQKNVEIFKKFKKYRDARLLITVSDPDLYFAALHSTGVKLTPLGQYYLRIAKDGRLGRV